MAPKVHVTFEFADEDEMRAWTQDRSATPAPAAPAAPVTPPPAAPQPDDSDDERTDATPTATDVDADGMPYDAEIHSDPPSFKADGTWRAKRGYADQEKAARAAFKAKGGAEPAPTLPTMPAGLPGASEPAPDPISWDKMIEKITGMMARGKLDNAALNPLYKKHGGADPVGTLQVNETARAALYADLCEIEPDLA